jgi:hypothetical protein
LDTDLKGRIERGEWDPRISIKRGFLLLLMQLLLMAMAMVMLTDGDGDGDVD